MHFGSDVVLDLLRKFTEYWGPVVIRTSKHKLILENNEFFLPIEVYELLSEFLRILIYVGTEALAHCQPNVIGRDLKWKVIIVSSHESLDQSVTP